MGEIDRKAFEVASSGKFPNKDWQETCAKLCSLWQQNVQDPKWHPFKMINIRGNLQEIVDEDDEKLKELRNEYGDVVYEAVSTALMEMNEYNASGRESMKLKIIAIVAILLSSMIGVCLPLFSGQVPSLKPDRNLFTIVKAFSSGVILATGYMHVLPDSFNDLMSGCLPENPWRKFPFTTFVAMLSAVLTLMVDSFAMSVYKKRCGKALMADANNGGGLENTNVVQIDNFEHGHSHSLEMNDDVSSQLLRHRVIAQVLELGIVVHSVVIGLAMGASGNQCTIRSLIAALCFHQMFEGMGLGGCILQAEYEIKMKAIMVFFFSATTPLGIVLGIGLSKVYSETSPTSLMVVGLLNACSAGLLNYMALVDLLAADFLGPKLQTNMKLQAWSYVAVLLGAGFMSLMAKWA